MMTYPSCSAAGGRSHANNSSTFKDLSSNDVLLGRGTGPNEHIGNIKFRALVREAIQRSGKKGLEGKAKAKLARDVMGQVKFRGGRFVRKIKTQAEQSKEETTNKNNKNSDDDVDDEEQQEDEDDEQEKPNLRYEEVIEALALDKIKQSFRHQLRNMTFDHEDEEKTISRPSSSTAAADAAIVAAPAYSPPTVRGVAEEERLRSYYYSSTADSITDRILKLKYQQSLHDLLHPSSLVAFQGQHHHHHHHQQQQQPSGVTQRDVAAAYLAERELAAREHHMFLLSTTGARKSAAAAAAVTRGLFSYPPLPPFLSRFSSDPLLMLGPCSTNRFATSSSPAGRASASMLTCQQQQQGDHDGRSITSALLLEAVLRRAGRGSANPPY